MAGDWVKLHRQILDSAIIKHPGLCQLWVYCLARANWKTGKWIVPGTSTSIEVPRGSFITGRVALHRELYPKEDAREVGAPSAMTLWRWLHTLETMGCVTTKTMSSRCTLITICNYGKYQDDLANNVPHMSSTCSADVPQVSTIEESKKERTKDDDRPPSPERFVEEWNNLIPFNNVKFIGPHIRKMFRFRCQTEQWLGSYRDALERIPSIPFLCGAGDNGWKINIEFFLKEDTVGRILAGSFDGNSSGNRRPGGHAGRDNSSQRGKVRSGESYEDLVKDYGKTPAFEGASADA